MTLPVAIEINQLIDSLHMTDAHPDNVKKDKEGGVFLAASG